jgi:hypothetical protein
VVKAWLTPKNVKDIRSFLGLAGYYRKFIQHYGVISKPLTDLLKKGVQFVWTHHHQEAFEVLKEALVSALVLKLPNFTKQFVIEINASDKGVGAVLMCKDIPLHS